MEEAVLLKAEVVGVRLLEVVAALMLRAVEGV